jgi:hypothetical protein
MITIALGLFLTIIGLLMLKFFPDMSDYQPVKLTMSGILIGIILILVGLVMMIVGWFYG